MFTDKKTIEFFTDRCLIIYSAWKLEIVKIQQRDLSYYNENKSVIVFKCKEAARDKMDVVAEEILTTKPHLEDSLITIMHCYLKRFDLASK